MDAFYPYITRTNTQPVESPNRLILPVVKYERIHGEASTEKKLRVGWQEPKKRQQQQQGSHSDNTEQHAVVGTIEEELHLIPTSHAVTPDADLHVDADGHLDIYV
ncbi:MAG: hypothetical protein ACK4NN_11480 [Rheinheimera sp.]|jgi:hypothetical protein